jgi:hypothetical protein
MIAIRQAQDTMKRGVSEKVDFSTFLAEGDHAEGSGMPHNDMNLADSRDSQRTRSGDQVTLSD